LNFWRRRGDINLLGPVEVLHSEVSLFDRQPDFSPNLQMQFARDPRKAAESELTQIL
jgi:hypothetical protein